MFHFELKPGDLWVHLGQRPLELFPANLVVMKGDAWAAKHRALEEKIVVLLEIRASGSVLRSAQRNAGHFHVRDVPDDAAKMADLITTGFVMGQGVMMGYLKNRHGDLLPEPFLHYPKTPDLLWGLLGGDD